MGEYENRIVSYYSAGKNSVVEGLLSFYYCIRSNIAIVVLPGLIILGRAIYEGTVDLNRGMAVVLYLILFILTFDIGNQINGVKEDRLNKPKRPLASGAWNVRNAFVMLFVFSLAFLVAGYVLDIFLWSLAWVALSIFHNFLGHRFWFLKNQFVLSLGAIVLICGTWQALSTLQEHHFWPFVITAISGGMGSVIQDLRDVEGDKKLNRRTLPIILGESRGLWVTLLFVMAGFVIFDVFFYPFPGQSQLKPYFFASILVIQVLNVAILVTSGKKKEYALAYNIYTFHFILSVATAILFV